jgi:membrane-associated phospholipid phosphatase
MRRRLALIDARVLPRGWLDIVRQLAMFLGAYLLYELVRGLVGVTGYKPFGDATRIIDFERRLHVFAEPQIQAWVQNHTHWLMDVADWTYVNAHFFLTAGALAYIYLRRSDSFDFVRNMFLFAMAIALVGYALYPTAPPRLLPEWGFTDSIRAFTGVEVEKGPASALLNSYAAVPSMHVCFALMIGMPMSRLVGHPAVKALWLLYPLFIAFVVIATGNHYFTDVFLGGLTAMLAAFLAKRQLAFLRARQSGWAAAGAPA